LEEFRRALLELELAEEEVARILHAAGTSER
jgi:hypothetical protein